MRTWSEVRPAVNWQVMGYGGNEDVLPLNPVKVMVVGSSLKKAGYRGPNKYITAMKQVHISEGHSWDPQLAQAQHRYNISTTRGLGPTRQSEPLPFDKVFELN